MIRLDRFLCEAGAGTRSDVKKLIKSGRVTVDGAAAQNAELKVGEGAAVCLDGKMLSLTGMVYYLLYKPAGVVCATRDARERTVLDLMKDAPGRDLFPVGRLDKDTEGLLLVTNDGALAHRLLSPKKHVDKTYLVRTRLPVTEDMCRRLAKGVEIGDETPTLPAVVDTSPGSSKELLLTIQEGRFHQVKRMLAAVGNEVVYLKRLSMGPLRLEDSLEKGCYRPLTEEERNMLGVSDTGPAGAC